MISSKTLVVSLVGAGCITAAGVGGYLAVKSDASPSAQVLSPDAVATTPVQVAEANPAPAPAAAAVPGPGPAVESKPAPAPKPATAPVPAPENKPAQAPAEVSVPDKSPAPAVEESPSTTDDAARNSAQAPVEMTPVAAVDPPKPALEEVTVHTDAVIGLRLSEDVSSATARVEDRVSARVTRDVVVDGRTAIPAGSMLEGTVTLVQRGGRFKERARLGIRFTSVVLANNNRSPIQTETIFRTGDDPTTGAVSKIGASAVVGAILGTVIGGKKGAAIGSTAGAAGGTAAVMASSPDDVVIAAGAPLTVRLTAPATLMIEREH